MAYPGRLLQDRHHRDHALRQRHHDEVSGEAGDKHSLVGLCMGEQGIISRVLGVRAGSALPLPPSAQTRKPLPDR